MRKIILSLILISGILNSCQAPKEKDISEIDDLFTVTDSLLNIAREKLDETSENFYELIEDSSQVDSVALIMNIPDSVGIYEYVELSINELNEIISYTQKEIYFAQDHLGSLKDEFLESQISRSDYLKEVTNTKELIEFLKERVDSNIYLINNRFNYLFPSTDSIL